MLNKFLTAFMKNFLSIHAKGSQQFNWTIFVSGSNFRLQQRCIYFIILLPIVNPANTYFLVDLMSTQQNRSNKKGKQLVVVCIANKKN